MSAASAGQPVRTALRPNPWWAEALARERTLALFALFMALAMVPAAVALGLDARTLRGVSVWAKPLKFMASLSLFAISTAWYIGLLPAARRQVTAVRVMVWTIVGFGGVEIAYIVLQAALGQASHYNRTDTLHQVLYTAMGAAALAMMLTQPALAWQIVRHGRTDVPALWRWAVVVGLVMTFVLGVAAAAPLSSAQPPSGPGLPLLGWQLAGGDLRPAHFIGSHAQQFVPLAGWMLWRGLPRQPAAGHVALLLFALAYTALWTAAFRLGLHGVVWTPPF